MKKLKQVLTVTLAAALVASTMGCAKATTSSTTAKTSSGATDYSKAKAETMTVFSETANFSGTGGGWFAKVMKDKFNVTLKYISGQGDGANLYNTRSASGNIGDIVIYGSSIQHFTDSVKAGLLTDMTDLLKTDGQYITKNYSGAVNRMKVTYGDNKAVYGLPHNVSTNAAKESTDGADLSEGNYLLWSAYKAAGLPKLSTFDDLLPALQKMQKARPKSDNGKQTYAFSLFKDWDGSLMNDACQYPAMYGWDQWGFELINPDASKVQSVLDKDGEYYKSLKLYFEANKLGLLDPDSYSQTYDDWAQKLKNGQTLSNWWSWCAPSQYNTTEHTSSTNSVAATGVKGADGYVLIPISDEKVMSKGFSPLGGEYTVTIGSKCVDKNRAMAIINWLYTPEGMETTVDGPKGLTWELKNGKPVLTDFGKKAMSDNTISVPTAWGGGSYKDGGSWFGLNCVNYSATDPNFNEPYYYQRWSSYTAKPTDLSTEWTKVIGKGTTTAHAYLQKNNQMVVVPGTAVLAPELTTDLSTKQSTVQSIIKKYSWVMIFSKTDSDFANAWNSMISESKAAGIDDVDKVFNDQRKKLQTARTDAIAGSTSSK